MPMHYVGIAGFPRRYYSYTSFDLFNTMTNLQMFISAAAIIAFLGQFIFAFNFVYSIFRGRRAPANPWRSNTLEWTTPINPGHGNWPGPIPHVHRWPYDYSKPGAEDDYIPQNVPLEQTTSSNMPHDKH
jgi:cytochrome c oxidase subunit 1